MTEEEYRAEIAKHARLANLIALRRLANESAQVSNIVSRDLLNRAIIDGLEFQ